MPPEHDSQMNKTLLQRRFPWWKLRRVLLPLIAGALGIWFLTRPAQVVEQVEPQDANRIEPQATGHCWFEQRGMDKFCFTYTTERG